jgi:hypothetical protein
LTILGCLTIFLSGMMQPEWLPYLSNVGFFAIVTGQICAHLSKKNSVKKILGTLIIYIISAILFGFATAGMVQNSGNLAMTIGIIFSFATGLALLLNKFGIPKLGDD